ncbi:MAG: Acetoin dehydrogenase E1 component beta-subunit, partial [uncultured Corynebacteriales bacterium]
GRGGAVVPAGAEPGARRRDGPGPGRLPVRRGRRARRLRADRRPAAPVRRRPGRRHAAVGAGVHQHGDGCGAVRAAAGGGVPDPVAAVPDPGADRQPGAQVLPDDRRAVLGAGDLRRPRVRLAGRLGRSALRPPVRDVRAPGDQDRGPVLRRGRVRAAGLGDPGPGPGGGLRAGRGDGDPGRADGPAAAGAARRRPGAPGGHRRDRGGDRAPGAGRAGGGRAAGRRGVDRGLRPPHAAPVRLGRAAGLAGADRAAGRRGRLQPVLRHRGRGARDRGGGDDAAGAAEAGDPAGRCGAAVRGGAGPGRPARRRRPGGRGPRGAEV